MKHKQKKIWAFIDGKKLVEVIQAALDNKNFAYIAGEGEGDARVVTTVDLREPGEELRELWVDAKDIRKETTMSDADYLAALQARGLEKLSEYRIIETISFEVNGNSNLIYKTDYDLGEKVTYQDDLLGISVDLFITEVTEIYEKNQMQALPVALLIVLCLIMAGLNWKRWGFWTGFLLVLGRLIYGHSSEWSFFIFCSIIEGKI